MTGACGATVRISQRDQRILALTSRKLAGETVDFNETIRALREAVDELIPAGRTFQLAEKSDRLDANPFYPLVRCYAAGFYPFNLGRSAFSL